MPHSPSLAWIMQTPCGLQLPSAAPGLQQELSRCLWSTGINEIMYKHLEQFNKSLH